MGSGCDEGKAFCEWQSPWLVVRLVTSSSAAFLVTAFPAAFAAAFAAFAALASSEAAARFIRQPAAFQPSRRNQLACACRNAALQLRLASLQDTDNLIHAWPRPGLRLNAAVSQLRNVFQRGLWPVDLRAAVAEQRQARAALHVCPVASHQSAVALAECRLAGHQLQQYDAKGVDISGGRQSTHAQAPVLGRRVAVCGQVGRRTQGVRVAAVGKPRGGGEREGCIIQ